MEYIIILIILVIILGAIIFAIWNIAVGKQKSQEKINNFTRNFNKSTENTSALVNTTFNKTKKSIEKKISKSYLTGCSWIITNEPNDNILFTFRNNNELLITTNGIVKRAEYELIIDNNSILITKDNVTEHYNIVNIKNDFLFLNMVSSNSILFLANNTKFKDEIKSALNRYAKEIYNLN
ncbi:hypothetical protein I215_11184 [Galbibacter marinus]|uniref:Uncharacterized protein n=1 Tax=Galbibacter marinus TaxID=555500 RepID=K2PPZ0_9FLAO|nr:hypothetical protein [Galbibacter marinus]EKF54630.1 hypothetical protein I215_11184 [Galbibacter marinus]